MSDLINKDQIRYTTNSFDCKTRTHEGDDDVQDSLPNRKFDVSVSSTKPCDRGGFIEVLDHNPDSIDMSLLDRPEGLVCIWGHDNIGDSSKPASNVLGRFCEPYLQGNQLRGTLILSEVEDDVLMKVREGSISDISIGYRVSKYEESREGEKPVITVTRWTPYEISLVAIGLDNSVGVNRSINNNKHTKIRMPTTYKKEYEESSDEKEKMPQSDKKKMSKEKMTDEKKFDITELETRVSQERTNERQRVDLVYRVADQFGLSAEERSYFIDNNSTGEEMMEKILEKRSNTKTEPIDMGPRDIPNDAKRQYSLGGVLDALCGNRRSHSAGLALEVSRDMEREFGALAENQMYVPWGALTRTYTVADTAAAQVGNGGQLISTPTLTDQLIEALRPVSILPRLGLNTQTGLTGNLKIPRQTRVSVPTNLENDTDAINETQGAYNFIEFSPHGIGALSKITKQLSYQVQQADSFIRQDLMREVGLRLDQQFFYGTNANGQVQGLSSLPGIKTTASGTNGNNLVGEMLLLGESEITNANVMGQPVAIVNSKTWAALKALRESNRNGAFLWSNDRDNSTMTPSAQFRGVPIMVSNMVVGNQSKGTGRGLSHLFMGVFDQAYWAQWGPGLVMERGFVGNDFAANVESIKLTTYVDFQHKHSDAFYYRDAINAVVTT